jgi:hypothetical protein
MEAADLWSAEGDQTGSQTTPRRTSRTPWKAATDVNHGDRRDNGLESLVSWCRLVSWW